ncbi:MAG: glycosyltransferase family 2 protein [Nitrospinales bacterium]
MTLENPTSAKAFDTSRLAVVIPAYNEESTLRDVTELTLAHINKVVIINDGSTDNTSDQLESLPVEILSNNKNEGKGFSLWRGFHHLMENEDYDALLTLDGDGQHAPEDIQSLIEEYKKYPNELIVGLRVGRDSSAPPIRYFANQFANFWISWAAGRRIPDSQCGFRIYPVSLLRKLQGKSNEYRGFVFESEVLIDAARLGFGIRPAPVRTIYKEGRRKSHFRPVADSTSITLMVAKKLFSSMGNIPGLANVLRTRIKKTKRNHQSEGGHTI